MTVIQHQDARAFLDRAGKFLEDREAENNLMFGICSTLIAHPESCANPFFATVEHDGEVVAAALTTPPKKLPVTRAPREALVALCEFLRERKISFPGVLAPVETSKAFAEIWTRATGKSHRIGRQLRIYQLDRVIPPTRCRGRERLATMEDSELLRDWWLEFVREIGEPDSPEEARAKIEQRIRDGSFLVWEDECVVSLAGAQGATPRGIRIDPVYTPEEFRERGYATSLVAALSQRLLDAGRRFCFLYTDLSNPTSNSIYQRIGYVPVCDCCDYFFE